LSAFRSSLSKWRRNFKIPSPLIAETATAHATNIFLAGDKLAGKSATDEIFVATSDGLSNGNQFRRFLLLWKKKSPIPSSVRH